MQAEILSFSTPNITVVYDSISLSEISRDKIRKMVPNHEPSVQDIPDEVIACVYPDLGLLRCVWDKRRVRVDSEEIHKFEQVVNLAVGANRLVQRNSKVIAYGFNFSVQLSVPNNKPDKYLKQVLIKDPDQLERKLDGTLESVEVSIVIKRKEEKIKFEFSPSDETLQAKINFHFGDVDKVPTKVTMNRSFQKSMQTAEELLSKIMRINDGKR
ncbi:MAG: hypothetical protein QGD88_03155 [Anaerolineae bacterium]|nr:hypothetical protein [Anaerolineae bacterium]